VRTPRVYEILVSKGKQRGLIHNHLFPNKLKSETDPKYATCRRKKPKKSDQIRFDWPDLRRSEGLLRNLSGLTPCDQTSG
jgi:hypothetical protein